MLSSLDVPYRISDGKPMRPYQLRAASAILKGNGRDGTAFICDMGLGKTAAVLQAIAELFNWNVIQRPVLVVAPILVCETVWRQEAANWNSTRHLTFSLIRGTKFRRNFALNTQAHVYLVNPELLDWLHTQLRGEWGFFDMLVVDESSMFKSHTSKRFKLLTNYGSRKAARDEHGNIIRDETGKYLKEGPHRFKRTVIMTGTPAPTSLLNLWSQVYLLDHGRRLHSEFETYRDRYFAKEYQVAEHTFKFGVSPDEFESRPEWMPKDGAPVRIHEHIADIAVELNAADYGVLPDTIGDASKGPVPPTHLHYVELPADIRTMYDRLEKEALVELGKDFIMAANGGAKSGMCHQITNGFLYKTDENTNRQTTEHLHDLKLHKLLDVLERINSHVIIAYWFVADRERIIDFLTSKGLPVSSLSGRNASQVIDRWNKGQVPILLLHPQSAGHGLNLQHGGNNIIWYSQIWSLERYLQTNARIARSGQGSIVGIHHIAGLKTIDELMLMTYLERGDNQSKFRAALKRYQVMRGWAVDDASQSGSGGQGEALMGGLVSSGLPEL
jgi:SNF2 family DNA or RNA helicase